MPLRVRECTLVGTGAIAEPDDPERYVMDTSGLSTPLPVLESSVVWSPPAPEVPEEQAGRNRGLEYGIQHAERGLH
jgi:hypothetical protein